MANKATQDRSEPSLLSAASPLDVRVSWPPEALGAPVNSKSSSNSNGNRAGREGTEGAHTETSSLLGHQKSAKTAHSSSEPGAGVQQGSAGLREDVDVEAGQGGVLPCSGLQGASVIVHDTCCVCLFSSKPSIGNEGVDVEAGQGGVLSCSPLQGTQTCSRMQEVCKGCCHLTFCKVRHVAVCKKRRHVATREVRHVVVCKEHRNAMVRKVRHVLACKRRCHEAVCKVRRTVHDTSCLFLSKPPLLGMQQDIRGCLEFMEAVHDQATPCVPDAMRPMRCCMKWMECGYDQAAARIPIASACKQGAPVRSCLIKSEWRVL
eukprot:1146956-Pelagomonas_calceolata.AAC.2